MHRPALLLSAAATIAGGSLGWWLRPDSAAVGGPFIPPARAARPSPVGQAAPVRKEEAPERMDRLLAAPETSRLELQALFMRWFELEPDLWPVFQELEKQHPDRAEDLTAAFFAAWAWRDCPAAGEKVRNSGLKYRSAGIAAVWDAACARGDASATQLEAGLFVKDWSSLGRLAARDPQAALAMLHGLRDTSNPPGSLMVIARNWAAVDGAAATAWAVAVNDDSRQVFREACLAWERQQPGAWQRTTGKLRERIQGDSVLSLTDPSYSNPTPGFLTLFHGNPEAQSQALQNPFATMQDVLAGMERTAVVGLKSTSPPRNPTNSEWSPADPQAALRELLAQPAGEARDRMAAMLLSRWNAADPEAAAAFAGTSGLPLPAPPIKPGDALKKVEGLPLAEAVAVAMPEGQPPDFNMLSTALMQEVKTDPAAVTAFLDQHMDQIRKGEGDWRMALGNAAYTWAQLDVNAAVEWSASLPAGPVRERAIGSTLEQLSAYDPESALKWMISMQHPERGSGEFGNVVGDLQQRIGKRGARRVIEASTLPDAKKQELLKNLR